MWSVSSITVRHWGMIFASSSFCLPRNWVSNLLSLSPPIRDWGASSICLKPFLNVCRWGLLFLIVNIESYATTPHGWIFPSVMLRHLLRHLRLVSDISITSLAQSLRFCLCLKGPWEVRQFIKTGCVWNRKGL